MLNPHHEADSAAAKGLRYMLEVGKLKFNFLNSYGIKNFRNGDRFGTFVSRLLRQLLKKFRNAYLTVWNGTVSEEETEAANRFSEMLTVLEILWPTPPYT